MSDRILEPTIRDFPEKSVDLIACCMREMRRLIFLKGVTRPEDHRCYMKVKSREYRAHFGRSLRRMSAGNLAISGNRIIEEK